LFFDKKDRVNIIFYSDKTYMVSLGVADGINYLSMLDNDMSALVPGGYGHYKVGALGKLADLDKNHELITQTASSIFSAKFNYYFFPKNSGIYLDIPNNDERIGGIDLFKNVFLGNYITSANFLDKIYIYFSLASKRRSDFTNVDLDVCMDKDKVLNEKECAKKYQGYFYQNFLREESKTISLVYNDIATAVLISRVIEGDGVCVVDYTQNTKDQKNNCVVEESGVDFSKTAQFLASSFDCSLSKNTVSIADIRLIFGKDMQKKWNVD
jgi:hypothetical protein